MKYQAGDLVVIKPRKLIEEQGNMTNHSDVICHVLEGTDRVVSFLRYSELGKGICWVKTKDGEDFAIPTNIILGHAFEYGEVIEVSRDGEKWFQEKFYQYKMGYIDMYETNGRCYQFARPIRKPKLEAVPENIRFELWKGKNLVLGISNTQNLLYDEEYKNWFVASAPFQSPIKTYLQPCKVDDLKVGDWYTCRDGDRNNIRNYNLVLEVGNQIKLAWVANGGVSIMYYPVEEISPLKVVRGEA